MEGELKKVVKDLEVALDESAYKQYPKLSDSEVKALVVERKWLAALDRAVHGEMDRISQSLTARVKELSERYGTALPQMIQQATQLEAKVNKYLEKMGFAWK